VIQTVLSPMLLVARIHGESGRRLSIPYEIAGVCGSGCDAVLVQQTSGTFDEHLLVWSILFLQAHRLCSGFQTCIGRKTRLSNE
jgi:hypothetical protein